MSKQTVYVGLKTALRVRGLPYHHVEDEACTIAFCSWDQFSSFDHFLDSISTSDDIKLCIYAEKVDGRGDGVAVTVSDEVQHLGYMTSRLDMKDKLASYEGLLSSLLRSGVSLLDYDYEIFTVELPPEDHTTIALPHYISHWQDASGQEHRTIHLEFAS